MAKKLLVIAQREDANRVISQEVLFVEIKLESFLTRPLLAPKFQLKLESAAHVEVTKRAARVSIHNFSHRLAAPTVPNSNIKFKSYRFFTFGRASRAESHKKHSYLGNKLPKSLAGEREGFSPKQPTVMWVMCNKSQRTTAIAETNAVGQ